VFSAAIEVVLTIAYREAVARRHAYVTLEHLLYALAHDNDGERILAACGADLPRLRRDLDAYLSESLEQTLIDAELIPAIGYRWAGVRTSTTRSSAPSR